MSALVQFPPLRSGLSGIVEPGSNHIHQLKNHRLGDLIAGGDGRIRTSDFFDVNEAL